MSEREEREARTLEFATVLASKATRVLAERTGATWVVTPSTCYLNWTLSFRCPGAPVGCIDVSDRLFSGLGKYPPVDTEYSLNWVVYRIVDNVLAFCLQKCIHGCCRKEPELPVPESYHPVETIRSALRQDNDT